MSGEPKVGSVGWLDLTVENAEGVRDFYRQVVGWGVEPVALGAAVALFQAGEEER